MATANSRHRLEIPESLWKALDQAAVRMDVPTAELAAVWLWQHLEEKAKEGGMFDGIRAPQPYDRENSRHYPRRPAPGRQAAAEQTSDELEAELKATREARRVNTDPHFTNWHLFDKN